MRQCLQDFRYVADFHRPAAVGIVTAYTTATVTPTRVCQHTRIQQRNHPLTSPFLDRQLDREDTAVDPLMLGRIKSLTEYESLERRLEHSQEATINSYTVEMVACWLCSSPDSILSYSVRLLSQFSVHDFSCLPAPRKSFNILALYKSDYYYYYNKDQNL